MNFPSNLLSIFNQHAGTMQPQDAVIDVPSSIQPVLEIPEAINEMTDVGDPTAVQRTSFIISQHIESTNTAGFTTRLCNIGPGLWDLDFNLFFNANFTTVTAGAHSDIFYTAIPGVSAVKLFTFYPLNTWITNVGRHFKSAIPGSQIVPFFRLDITLQTTGVGQTINCFLSIVGNRIG